MDSATRSERKRERLIPESRHRRGGLFGGGIDGNEQLTATAGVILIGLFAVLGVTIVRVGQLLWLHLFLGILLLGPVTLKLASTVYRFARYYLRTAIYVAKGPPVLALRAMGPLLVAATALVFVTGVVLLFEGPRSRATMVLIHKVSFIVWLVLFACICWPTSPGSHGRFARCSSATRAHWRGRLPEAPPAGGSHWLAHWWGARSWRSC